MQPQDWLSDSEMTMWRLYLHATNGVWDAMERDLQSGAALTMAEYDVLVALSEAPGRELRMSGLAERLVCSRSRLTHTINRMEQAGLVERHRSVTDKRGIWCRMTPAGRHQLIAAAPYHLNSVRRRLFDHLTDQEVETMATVMGKLWAALQGAGEEADQVPVGA